MTHPRFPLTTTGNRLQQIEGIKGKPLQAHHLHVTQQMGHVDGSEGEDGPSQKSG